VPLPPPIEPWFFTVAAFLFGLIFGSFLNVCIYRLPRGLSVVHPRSACPSCNTAILAADNIPVVSWFVLGGKCRHCQAPIAKRYWIVELATGALFALSFAKFGPSMDALKLCVFSFLVLGLIFTDADTKLLPDDLTLTGLGLGLAFSLFTRVAGFAGLLLDDVTSTWRAANATRALSFADAVLGALLAALFIWGMGELWYRLRGIEAMGFGDVKFMAMVGAFLGIKLAMLTILLGSFSGSVFGFALIQRRFSTRYTDLKALLARKGLAIPETKLRARAQRSAGRALRLLEIPFGVFLGAGALVAAFAGQPLVDWYMGLFR
jgi:leader peptidase (prepilin peptidase)/N-methyltransferase